MKKLLITLICALNLFALNAVENNIIFEKSYSTEEISQFSINLTCEKLEVESYIGTEISIQVSSNNLKMMPEINLTNEKLSVKSTITRSKKGEYCLVKFYIPEDYSAQKFIASTLSGSVNVKNLSAITLINLKTQSGSINADDISAANLELSSMSGSINSEIGKSDFFDIETQSGSIETCLYSSPSAFSSITSISGSISLFLQKDACLQLSASTTSGKISDDINKTVLFSKNKYLMPFGTDGASLNLTSTSGNIRIKPL